ncbi:MAG: 3-hydroxyacyl-CoA dehydrogenase NAD-binding domain-containing protein [Vulcanimicrobiota bacterium]
MSRKILKAAVLGAGTMGAGIAAHLANAGIPVLLLDIAATGDDPNAIVKKGWERALKSKPAALMETERAHLVSLGNMTDDFDKLASMDWVVEAIVERLDIKQQLHQRLEESTGDRTIISSNSSGIPMALQVQGRSESFKKRFLGTHFFNPPRYLHLLELIPTAHTDPEVVQAISEFGDKILGKGIVVAHDVPGFAANRVGVGCMSRTMQVMAEMGLSPDVVDLLTGPLVGRPKSATCRTADLSGLDIVTTVADNIHKATGELVKFPEVMDRMVERGLLGEKSGAGFYKKEKSGGKTTILTLNFDTFEYEDRGKVRLDELNELRLLPTPEERVKALLESEGQAGEFTRRTLFHQIHYAAGKVGEVAATAQDVDNALKWGFGWEVGPLELAESLGRERCIQAFSEHGLEVPAYFQSERPPAAGTGLLTVKQLNNKVLGNSDATLWDAGDGVALLQFHSKGNSIGAGTLEMFDQAHQEVSRNFLGMVIGNQGQHFCAGADVSMILQLAREQNFEAIRKACRTFQGMTSRLRYAPYPVVSAPFGMTLGGGCEVMLYSDLNIAHAELYTGLVEVGVGILPAGGGTTEMLIRMNERLLKGADPFSAVQQAFELIAMGTVSTSAKHARSLGLLRSTDRVVMNADRLLSEAKKAVLELADGYLPPVPRTVQVLGESAFANLCTGAHGMMLAGFITEYEYHLAETIARVLCGGEMNRADVVSETVLLELEEEAFLQLSGKPQTQERLAHTLKTGKTLRN